ncbi:MAG: hypothetical protein IJ617_01445 [Oscillospiraceae bacterium]|nr:hypothetical protein [Oscillospiraceae bacterium]
MSEKVKFALYLPAEKKAEIERRYTEDGSRSQTEFVEHAVEYYLDYLSANNAGAFLPTAIQAVIDGRLGMLEDRIAGLLFTNSVTVDELAETFALVYKINEDTMRHIRSKRVDHVKQTNGRVSFDQKVRDAQRDS